MCSLYTFIPLFCAAGERPPVNPVKDDFPKRWEVAKRSKKRILKRIWTKQITAYTGTTLTAFPVPGYTGVKNRGDVEFEFFNELFEGVGRFIVTMTNKSVRHRHRRRRQFLVDQEAEASSRRTEARDRAEVEFLQEVIRQSKQLSNQPAASGSSATVQVNVFVNRVKGCLGCEFCI